LDCYVDGNVQEECLDLFNCLLEDTGERNVGRTQFFGTANKKNGNQHNPTHLKKKLHQAAMSALAANATSPMLCKT